MHLGCQTRGELALTAAFPMMLVVILMGAVLQKVGEALVGMNLLRARQEVVSGDSE